MTDFLRRRASLLLIAAALAAGVVAWQVDRGRLAKITLEPTRVVTVKKVREASGLAWWPSRGHLLTVADSGVVAEITLDGDLVRERRFPGLDFEDVALIDDHRAWIVDEQQHLLVMLRLDDFELGERHTLPVISPAKGTNRMFEGIALDRATGRILLAHESHPAALVTLEADGITPGHTSVVDAPSVSGVELSPDGKDALLVSNQGYLLLMGDGGRTLAGEARTSWRRIEGCALVPGVGLVTCVDANESKLLVFGQLATWDAIRSTLAGRKSR